MIYDLYVSYDLDIDSSYMRMYVYALLMLCFQIDHISAWSKFQYTVVINSMVSTLLTCLTFKQLMANSNH